MRRRSLERDEDKCAVIAEFVAACAAASGVPVDAATRREVAGRLEAGFADRVVTIVTQMEGGWQRGRFDAAMRHRPRQECALQAAFRALTAAELDAAELARIGALLDRELDAAADAVVETLRTSRYDESARELVPREASCVPPPGGSA